MLRFFIPSRYMTFIQRRINVNATSYIEDIQIFGMNMTFISSSEVKKCIFHECRRHE